MKTKDKNVNMAKRAMARGMRMLQRMNFMSDEYVYKALGMSSKTFTKLKGALVTTCRPTSVYLTS